MLNFNYYNPCRLVFGRDAEKEAGNLAASVLGGKGRVLVVYGGGSVVRSGLLARVEEALTQAGHTVVARGGVQPNPQMSFVHQLLEEFKDDQIDLVLGVGGGSVIDTAKSTAVALKTKADPWPYFAEGRIPTEALPVMEILTLPAAGSEQSIRSVMTHEGIKTGIGAECIRPKVAIINPELFMTLPLKQVGSGVVDMMSHIMERYFSATDNTDYVDAQSEAALRTAMEHGRKVYQNPKDYDAWCQVAMVGTFAHNGYFGLGRQEDWACHAMEHEISGWNDAIVHGMGLAILIPNWMRYVSQQKPARFVQFAQNVMGITPQESDTETIELGIAKLCAFYQDMGMPLKLSELGVTDCPVAQLAERCCRCGPVGKLLPLAAADVAAIMEASL